MLYIDAKTTEFQAEGIVTSKCPKAKRSNSENACRITSKIENGLSVPVHFPQPGSANLL